MNTNLFLVSMLWMCLLLISNILFSIGMCYFHQPKIENHLIPNTTCKLSIDNFFDRWCCSIIIGRELVNMKLMFRRVNRYNYEVLDERINIYLNIRIIRDKLGNHYLETSKKRDCDFNNFGFVWRSILKRLESYLDDDGKRIISNSPISKYIV